MTIAEASVPVDVYDSYFNMSDVGSALTLTDVASSYNNPTVMVDLFCSLKAQISTLTLKTGANTSLTVPVNR